MTLEQTPGNTRLTSAKEIVSRLRARPGYMGMIVARKQDVLVDKNFVTLNQAEDKRSLIGMGRIRRTFHRS